MVPEGWFKANYPTHWLRGAVCVERSVSRLRRATSAGSLSAPVAYPVGASARQPYGRESAPCVCVFDFSPAAACPQKRSTGPVCIATPSVTDDSPRTVVESIETGGSGSTEELVATTRPSLYQELRDPQKKSIALPFGTLLRRAVMLGDLEVEDEIGTRAFGTSVEDFTRLCRNIAWDYPNGLVLMNLDRGRCLIFPAETCFVSYAMALLPALKWMQSTPGTFGLTLRAAKGGRAECTLFAVLFFEEHGDAHLTGRAERLLRLVQSWG